MSKTLVENIDLDKKDKIDLIYRGLINYIDTLNDMLI